MKITLTDVIKAIKELDCENKEIFTKQKAQLMAKVAQYGMASLIEGIEYRDSLEPQLTEDEIYKLKEENQ